MVASSWSPHRGHSAWQRPGQPGRSRVRRRSVRPSCNPGWRYVPHDHDMPADAVRVARTQRILARLSTSGRIVPTHPGHAMWQRVWNGLVADVTEAARREEQSLPVEERRQRYRGALEQLGYSRAQTLAAAYGQPVDWRRPRGDHGRAHRVPRPRSRARAARRPSGARRAAARAPAGSDSPSRPDLAERVRVLEAALAVLDLLERESVVA